MPAGPLVGIEDTKAYLRIKSGTDDVKLGGFLDDAVAAVADIIGPVTPTSYTEVVDNHGPLIVLARTPVQSVQSVMIQPWLGAAPIDDTAAWQANSETGVLRRLQVGGSMPFYGSGSVFTITYTAGRGVVPAPVNRAILMQVADMWEAERGSMPMAGGGGDAPPPSYSGDVGFLAPEVMELLLPYLAPPGVA